MIKDFREFIMRGNVLDMAVGVIMGGAFGGIVNSLVKDVMMPPLGLLMGRVDFSNLFVVLQDGAKVAGPYASLTLASEAGAGPSARHPIPDRPRQGPPAGQTRPRR